MRMSNVFKWLTTYINTRTRGGDCIIKMSGASESTPVPEWCKVGGFIDAKDTVNSWCVARVVELDTERNRILVNYDGWSKNYNNVLNINSSKIAPLESTLPLILARKNTHFEIGPSLSKKYSLQYLTSTSSCQVS